MLILSTSADAVIDTSATGAMSYAFIKAIKANPQQSYVQLLNSIREILAGEYDQKPQLSCSHPLGKSIINSKTIDDVLTRKSQDTNLLFVM